MDQKKKNKNQTEKIDYQQAYLRALADYQNLQKQQIKEREEFVKFALNSFLEKLFPVYDHLKLSLKSLKEEDLKNPWVLGVQAVSKQFKDLLTEVGVEEIEVLGKEFDPQSMEALGGQGLEVVQEVLPGYKIQGKVLRPAKVLTAEKENNLDKNTNN